MLQCTSVAPAYGNRGSFCRKDKCRTSFTHLRSLFKRKSKFTYLVLVRYMSGILLFATVCLEYLLVVLLLIMFPYIQAGVTLLLINLSNQTEFKLNVRNILNVNLHTTKERKLSFIDRIKSTFSWVGSKSTKEGLGREEYHLTPEGGDLKSKTMLLNGFPLQLTQTGDIPHLNPNIVDVNSPVVIAPLTMKFIQFPNFDASGCT